MGRRLILGIALSSLVIACGGAATSGDASADPASAVPTVRSADPSGSAPPSEPGPSDAPPSTPPEGVITLSGTMTGHASGPLSSADQTAQFELEWHAGPDDVHDIRAFRFQSGSYTASVSIEGVCGGSRSEAGAFDVVDDTAMSVDLGPDDQIVVQLIDSRVETGDVLISGFTGLYVQEPDPAGCGNSSSYGMPVCALEFGWLDVGVLEEQAHCEDASLGVVWDGTLVPAA
jgi:hypothetical protein